MVSPMKIFRANTRLTLFSAVVLTIALLKNSPSLRAGNDEPDAASTAIRPQAIRADMQFLADDLLEGRGTGTRGHEIAAKFMATEFEAMGLEPAGDKGTFFQNVPLRSIRPDEERTIVNIVRGGKEEALKIRQDFVTLGDPGRTEVSVQGPVVYVGFGVTAPEQGYDDYAGLEAKGKIVAFLYGAPPGFEPAIRAHYSSGVTKAANAAAHGAVGIILLDSPDLERLYPFHDRVRDLAFPYMRWMSPQQEPNDYFPGLSGSVILNMQTTARLFEDSGTSCEEIYAAASTGKRLSVSLPLTMKTRIVSKHEAIQSPNVVARLPGSDPRLRDEYVVYSAHLDHLGIGEPVNGDRIYNGAMDNASGSACLLEIARAYTQVIRRPRRSILFVSVTGEEEGLLGSDFFAHYPTIAKGKLIADINMDGAALLWPMEDVVARGAEHSTLAADVREAAARMNIDVSSDPHPESVLFIRSDQYSFVRQGVPSLFLGSGYKSSNPDIKPEEIRKAFLANRYHKPQDDMNQAFDFESGARFARLDFLLGYIVAQKTERPAWNPGDFFGEKYAKTKN
jgi:hypothetical protein